MSNSNNSKRSSYSSQANTNLVDHALSSGTTQHLSVTAEQANALCKLVHEAKPATPELRQAAARARQFKFVAR